MTPFDIARLAYAKGIRARGRAEMASVRAGLLRTADVEQLALSRELIANSRHRLSYKEGHAPLDKDFLKHRLQQAEKHVAAGTQHVVRQRELVTRLERKGLDSRHAKEILQQFEELLEMHEADRNHILRELEKLAPGTDEVVTPSAGNKERPTITRP